MKNSKILPLLTIFYFLIFTFNSSAQNVGINNTGAKPDASALLDLNATDKGFLITRADTLNINAPAFGLMTLSPIDSCLYLYNGIHWIGMGGAGSNCSCGVTSSTYSCGFPLIDTRDNNTYGTVKIGKQCWMSENLAYLPAVIGSDIGNNNIPYYYVYDFEGTDVAAAKNHNNYSTYGVLYNWVAAMDGSSSSSANPSGRQGVCPTGWHIPSDAEWKELEMELGMTQAEADAAHWRGTNEGDKLKAISFGGNNSSGFTALPAGRRLAPKLFYYQGSDGSWWTAKDSGSSAWARVLNNSRSEVYRLAYAKGFGHSVRCVKD